jgi:hypothetical protein
MGSGATRGVWGDGGTVRRRSEVARLNMQCDKGSRSCEYLSVVSGSLVLGYSKHRCSR